MNRNEVLSVLYKTISYH